MNYALYSLAAGIFAISISSFIITGLLPEIANDLHVSLATAGMIVGWYALGTIFGSPILTIITRNLNKKKTLLVMMAVCTIGNLLCAVSFNYLFLIVARIITALSQGVFMGISSIVAISLVTKDKKASAISTIMAGMVLANIIGIPGGTLIGQFFGWKTSFFLVAIIDLISLIGLFFLLPNINSHTEIKISDEIKSLFKLQIFLGLLQTCLFMSGYSIMMTYIASFLSDVFKFNHNIRSLSFLLFGVGVILGNRLSRKADKSIEKSLYISFIGLSFTFILMFLGSYNKIVAMISFILLGIFGYSAGPALQSNIINRNLDHNLLSSSLNVSSFGVGQLLGVVLGGAIINAIGLSRFMPFFALIFSLVAILIVWISKNKYPSSS